MGDEEYNKAVENVMKIIQKKRDEAIKNMENDVKKQIDQMKTGIGALAEITGIFYTSLSSVPGLNTPESDVDKHLLTKSFIDSFVDHIFNPGGKND